ncbi:hypothetical protein AtubIFM55763_010579 [Aspergillus tubingensis]|uniref:Uncharacterized protein n=2 Tax=Aspergillus subgen. Circumdati TaxID=2720871 RepID=A0A100ILW1_ASPNG|nr:prolyl oligopeptidase family protein [Aspergillus tubingensis]GAQ43592.1 hypothetical protein AKAW_06929 [Aspergillus niger]GFN21422.1 prolyl oligopeptidase family protein [Aspergillus tubingensis]GLA78092.1 hypothetical protein AtubIFM55763_010579 [Aspergillus tubingensis]GLA83764.1 hypothetical protein AtubIFM56815_007970 [Aspergillus tubingensis]
MSIPYLNGLVNGHGDNDNRGVPMSFADLNASGWNGDWDLAPACAEAQWRVELEANPDLPADRLGGVVVFRGLDMRLFPIVNGQAQEPFEYEREVEWVSESNEFEEAFYAFCELLAQEN